MMKIKLEEGGIYKEQWLSADIVKSRVGGIYFRRLKCRNWEDWCSSRLTRKKIDDVGEKMIINAPIYSYCL